MLIRTFDELKPVMMVVCVDLCEIINLGVLFNLIPITYPYDGPYVNGKNNQIISLVDGSIISAKFSGKYRGNPKISTKRSASQSGRRQTIGGCFKNSITLALSINKQNICVKIYKDKIHVTGVKSYEWLYYTLDICIQHILNVKSVIDYCGNNPNIIRALPYIMLQNEQGDESCNIKSDDIPSYIFRIFDELFRPTFDVTTDDRTSKYYSINSNTNEYFPMETCLGICEWIINTPYVCSDSLTFISLTTILTNYNYDIGFKIIKPKVKQLLDGVDEFECDMELGRCFITITLPFGAEAKQPNSLKIITTPRRVYVITELTDIPGSETRHHTFMMYDTGNVTQSGSTYTAMKYVYDKFMTNIALIENQIRSEV